MIEKLYPLKFPPGIFHNGTKTQAAGRWYDGNGVRFSQGTVQPIGGWVERTLTGATIAGVPNDAIGLLRNDDTKYLIVGTTEGLYAVSDSNVVYDITPTVLVGQTTLDWVLETFGQDLVATVTPFVNTNNNNLYKWEGDTSAVAVLVVEPHDALDRDTANYFEAPNSVRGLVATGERFLMLLQGADPAVGIGIDVSAAASYRASRSGFTYTIDPGEKIID